mgnify:CR=1 FL=1
MISKEALTKIGIKYGKSAEEIKTIYKTYWKAVKEILESADFTDYSEDNKDKVPIINIAYIGRFNCTPKKYRNIESGIVQEKIEESRRRRDAEYKQNNKD